jgi:hypothetical protein
MFGGEGPNGELAFVAEERVKLDVLKKLSRTRLLTDKVGVHYSLDYPDTLLTRE